MSTAPQVGHNGAVSTMERGSQAILGTRRWATAAWLVGGVTAIGLLNLSIALTSELASRSRVPAAKVVVWEMTGAYTALLVLPLLLVAMRRYPIERRNLGPRLALFLGLFAAASVVHTLGMWGSRIAVYRLLGWGPYDYGDMRFRFLMEGGKHLLFYSALLALVTALGYARRSRAGELAASRLAAELTGARLEALKMQLNPHFLFNTLNMISSHVHSDPDTADAMIGHLSDLLRETLRHSKAQEVPLERELELLGAYLAITKARFEERLQVELDVAAECRQALVPHLVLQPLVENAVTHCMADPTRAGWVRVGAHAADRRLALTVEDNGPGLTAGGPAPARGVGLSNTAERLRHLYGDGHRLELANRPEGGLRVLVEVPLRVGPMTGTEPA